MYRKYLVKKRKQINYFLELLEKHTFLTAVVMNITFLVLVLLFCEVKYETSDDYIMSAIMAGDFGDKPNPHLIFINIIWGYLLLPFYYILPKLSWYLIFQLLLCFLSFTAVSYVLLKKLDVMMAFLISFFFIIIYSNDAYIVVQFTKTAILAVMSGSVIFLHSLFNESKYKKREICIGGVLVFLGSLVRFNCIFIAGGFLLVIIVLEFVKLLNKKDVNKRRNLIKIIVSGIVLIGIVTSAKYIDQFIYNSDDSYAYFREFGSVRGDIVDRSNYGYEVCKDEYSKIGISENDYKLLRTWNFADPDFYTLKRMKKAQNIIVNYQNSHGLDRDEVKYVLRERNYWAYPSFLSCVIIVLLSIIFIKRYWCVSVISAGIGYLYLYYFAASGRIVYRIEYGVFLCIFMTCIYFWDKKNYRNLEVKTEIKNVCAILLMLLCIFQLPKYRLNTWGSEVMGEEYKNYVEDIFFESWNYDSRRYRCAVWNENAFSELQEEIVSNSTNFYFMNFSTTIQTLYLNKNPWINRTSKSVRNSLYLAGIDINFPDVLEIQHKKEVDNPIKSLIEDNVYLVDNFYHEEILTYLQEHYYPNARKELYKTLDGFNVWKFYEN